MSKSVKIKAREYGEQQLEALDLPARLELELDDGSTVTVLNPWLWDEDVEKAVNESANPGDEPQNVRYARAVLGKREYARFIKGGGQPKQIALAVASMKRGILPSGGEEADDPKGK